LITPIHTGVVPKAGVVVPKGAFVPGKEVAVPNAGVLVVDPSGRDAPNCPNAGAVAVIENGVAITKSVNQKQIAFHIMITIIVIYTYMWQH